MQEWMDCIKEDLKTGWCDMWWSLEKRQEG